MVNYRGIDTDLGWINRKFTEVQRQIESLRSERRFGTLPTTSASANMVVDAITGGLARSTSSDRYKQDVEDLDLNLADVLKMRPRVWRDKSDVAKRPGGAPRYVGFIAEELHDAGLGLFVGYDTEGQPESVAYDRLTVALLILAKVQQARLAALATRATALESESAEQATRVATLENAVADLTARLSVLEPAATTTPLTE